MSQLPPAGAGMRMPEGRPGRRADEIGDEVVLVEAVENLQRIGIDLAAGDGVPGTRHDHRDCHRSAL